MHRPSKNRMLTPPYNRQAPHEDEELTRYQDGYDYGDLAACRHPKPRLGKKPKRGKRTNSLADSIGNADNGGQARVD